MNSNHLHRNNWQPERWGISGRIFKRVVLPGNEMIAYRQCLSKCQWCCAVGLLWVKGAQQGVLGWL